MRSRFTRSIEEGKHGFCLNPLHPVTEEVEGDHIVVFEREKKRKLSLHDKVNDSIYVSRFEGLNLVEYINVCQFVCKSSHQQPCRDCKGKLCVARYIVEHGFVKLTTAFAMSCPNVKYSAKDARRKLLQMPISAIGVGEKNAGTYCFFLVEKKSHMSYVVF